MSERVACTTRSTEKQAGASAGEADQHTAHNAHTRSHARHPFRRLDGMGRRGSTGQGGLALQFASGVATLAISVDAVDEEGYHGTIQYAAPRRTRLCCRRKQPTARIDSAAIAVYCTMLPLAALGLVLPSTSVRKLAMLLNAFRRAMLMLILVFIDWVHDAGQRGRPAHAQLIPARIDSAACLS